MARIEIPEDIRTAINTLDTAAQELLDWHNDIEFSIELEDGNGSLIELLDILDDIQLKVTETQQEQEWI
jgi:hypothetical protein